MCKGKTVQVMSVPNGVIPELGGEQISPNLARGPNKRDVYVGTEKGGVRLINQD